MSTTVKTIVALALVATIAACTKKEPEVAPAADAPVAEQPMGKY